MTSSRLPALALAATCVALIVTAQLRATVEPFPQYVAQLAPRTAQTGPVAPERVSQLPRATAPVLAASRLVIAARTQYQGVAGWAAASHGPRYLAMREPRGTRVLLCGPAACAEMTVSDWGPSSRIRPRRVADIAVGVWERLAGVPRRYGLFLCSVTILSRPSRERAVPVGPETDVR